MNERVGAEPLSRQIIRNKQVAPLNLIECKMGPEPNLKSSSHWA